MDVLTLASHCGAGVDPVTTAAIVKLESGYDPLVIRDNTLQVTRRSGSLEEAKRTVEQLLQAGHRLAIGLMQVTTPWATRLGFSPTELLDPCRNVATGTWILKHEFGRCAPSGAHTERLSCALSAYWSGNGRTGGVYANAVYAGAMSPVRMVVTPGVTDGLLGSAAGHTRSETVVRMGAGFDFE